MSQQDSERLLLKWIEFIECEPEIMTKHWARRILVLADISGEEPSEELQSVRNRFSPGLTQHDVDSVLAMIDTMGLMQKCCDLMQTALEVMKDKS